VSVGQGCPNLFNNLRDHPVRWRQPKSPGFGTTIGTTENPQEARRRGHYNYYRSSRREPASAETASV
jgi:hypothetical protein